MCWNVLTIKILKSEFSEEMHLVSEAGRPDTALKNANIKPCTKCSFTDVRQTKVSSGVKTRKFVRNCCKNMMYKCSEKMIININNETLTSTKRPLIHVHAIKRSVSLLKRYIVSRHHTFARLKVSWRRRFVWYEVLNVDSLALRCRCISRSRAITCGILLLDVCNCKAVMQHIYTVSSWRRAIARVRLENEPTQIARVSPINDARYTCTYSSWLCTLSALEKNKK